MLIAEPDPLVAQGLAILVRSWAETPCVVVDANDRLSGALAAVSIDLALVNLSLIAEDAAAWPSISRQGTRVIGIASSDAASRMAADAGVACLAMPFSVADLRAALCAALATGATP